MAIWAIPRACRNADFTWSGQPRGNGIVQELWAIQTVITQAVPGCKSSAGRQKRLVNWPRIGLECGKIVANSGIERPDKNAGLGLQLDRCQRELGADDLVETFDRLGQIFR